ncbi:MAG: DUF2059 domain-containing protein [Paraglaciecola sp.]|uniref:DUF2059 domain-containing protein n=1 Tax=Pseudomonadati TaxID=3379134 RepID=UPI00273E3EA8|nr:DUF2059 domain-containing protein [Paraglaciecola sp.]MDP5029121.1 DUF2059 domain-containing protein [Paraglaciecola sp.]MDP5129426.1 DUF2059 domain-containing protein [Paraglaciecola sp.]
MKKICMALVGLSLAFASVAQPAKKASIEQLMQLTGAGDLSAQMMNQMLPAMQQMIPDAPPTFWDTFKQELDANELMKMIIPVYQKHLSEEDIQAILAFYSTPAGKKLISAQPAIMQESMMIGQQWGQQVFMRAKQKFDAMSAAQPQ